MRVVSEPVKAPVPKLPFSVVVAVSPPLSVETVPQAKPRTVGPAPPVAVMLPFRVAVVWPTEDADWVVTVGEEQAEVVNEAEMAPRPVPTELVAYALE